RILVTRAIFAFLASWNDFLWPLIILADDARQTLPVAIAALAREHAGDHELMSAGPGPGGAPGGPGRSGDDVRVLDAFDALAAWRATGSEGVTSAIQRVPGVH